MKNQNELVNHIYVEVLKFCDKITEEEQRGYAQAAWFVENGKEEIAKQLQKDNNQEWLKKAEELEYEIIDINIKPFISTYGAWYSWTSFELKINNYGSHSFDQIIFPNNSELSKSFLAKYADKEQEGIDKKEQERKAKEQEITEKKRKEQEEKLAREEEKKKWILENGSQYLKDCLELGQYAHKNYVLERAEKEFDGFILDYDDRAKWDIKYSPSQEAINELKELRKIVLDSDIIWLTKGAIPADEEDDRYYEFEPCEALIVKNFLGKYDLIKVI